MFVCNEWTDGNKQNRLCNQAYTCYLIGSDVGQVEKPQHPENKKTQAIAEK